VRHYWLKFFDECIKLSIFLTGAGSCVGDSGGGFALERNEKWFLRGVVSFGASKTVQGDKITCDPHLSALYVDLGEYMDWIVRTLAN